MNISVRKQLKKMPINAIRDVVYSNGIGRNDEFLLNDYYNADYYYYTDWDDEFQYEEIDGILKQL